MDRITAAYDVEDFTATGVDAGAISYDAFYEFLKGNAQYDQGRVVGEVLMAKHALDADAAIAALNPPEVDEKTSEGIRKLASLIPSFEDAQGKQDALTHAKRNMMTGLSAYHRGNLYGDNAERSEGLFLIKGAIDAVTQPAAPQGVLAKFMQKLIG